MIMAWITNSVEPDITESILWMESTHETWKDIMDHYHLAIILCIFYIQKEICELHQGDQTIT